MKKDRIDSSLNIVFAGDRDIAVRVLRFIIEQGNKPIALMVPDDKKTTHADELIRSCSYLECSRILKGNFFRTEEGIKLLHKLRPDYIICVHFPYIFPKRVLNIPKVGIINLHPAYLPYNRGWHTPTWAIWEETPYGASLHFMDHGLDTGNIIYQEKLKICPADTADILYQRVKELEFNVFKKAWPSLVSHTYIRHPQSANLGTMHKKQDITSIQEINLNKKVKAGDLIRKLRALTTNNLKEAAYFKVNSRLYRIQIRLKEAKP